MAKKAKASDKEKAPSNGAAPNGNAAKPAAKRASSPRKKPTTRKTAATTEEKSRVSAPARDQDQRWNNNWRIHVIINLADEGEKHGTVNHRHRKIENENAVTFFQRQLKTVLWIGRGIYFTMKPASQRLTDQADERRVVINDTNPFFAHGRRLR